MKTLCTLLFSLIYTVVFAVFSSAAGTETPPDTLVLQFKPGWSIFSAHVMPDNPELTFIFQPLINSGKLIKIQDENGNALEDYGFLGGWINNIGNFQEEKGYKIKVNAASTLSFTGQLTVLPFRIPLKAGWNLMGFPLKVPEDAKAVVQQLIDRNTLVKVQDDEGNAIEDFGVLGGWLNNIGMMAPGKGYKIKLSARDTLVFSKPNTPPVFTGTIADITINKNTSTTIDLKTYFLDIETPSANLTYNLAGLSLGTYSITNGVLTITGTTAGSETDLRTSASDEGTAANSNYFGLTVNDVVQKSTVTFKFRNAATNTDLTTGTSTLRYKKTGDAGYTTTTSTNGTFTIDLDKNIAYEIDGSHSGDLETSISEPPTYIALKRPGDMEAFEQRAFQDSSSPVTFTNATETIYVYKLMSGFPIMEMIDYTSTDGNGINNGTRKFSTSNSTAPLWIDLRKSEKILRNS